MNKRRLLKLAGLLEANAKNRKGAKFDLAYWGTVEKAEELMSCGTTACAAGLAAISGAFKRQGLSYRLEKRAFSEGFNIEITLNGLCVDDMENGTNGSFISVQKFFDLTIREGEFLFLPNKYPGLPTKEAAGEFIVAQRIRQFVDGKVAP